MQTTIIEQLKERKAHFERWAQEFIGAFDRVLYVITAADIGEAVNGPQPCPPQALPAPAKAPTAKRVMGRPRNKGGLSGRAREAIDGWCEPFTCATLATKLGCTNERASQVLDGLKTRGEVRQTGKKVDGYKQWERVDSKPNAKEQAYREMRTEMDAARPKEDE
jgi:hypothetical protein